MKLLLGSIRAQVQLMAALSTATALAVACAAFMLNDWRMLSSNKEQQLYRYAAVVARNASPELAEGDWLGCQTQLASLKLEPTITAACLYNARGEVVATYRRDEVLQAQFPQPEAEAYLRSHGGDEIELFQPIHQGALRAGSLYVRSTRDDIEQQSAAHPLIVGVVFLISLGVAAVFASRMQRKVSKPIEALSQVARRVTADGDYSARVTDIPGGELGDLCYTFNGMLQRVETTDQKLQEAHDNLNARVRERTRELHREVLERRYAESIASGQKRVLQQLATGRPLTEVLTSLVEEIESHIRNTHAAISLVEPGQDWLGEPIAQRLSGDQRDGLRQLPIMEAGSAPARAAATLVSHYDCQHAASEYTDPAGFDSTGHGGACWAVPVVTSDGRLLAVISLFHRSDRRPSDEETELIGSACSLASLAIEQRNGEEALKSAMRKATTANRAKSDFLANMSHEIRTPLNAILGFADLLLGESEDLDAERRGYLDTISSSGKHLLALINDILDLSKIEAAQVAIDVAETDPHRTLVEVMSLLRVRAVDKGVSLDCEWRTPAPTRIQTDAARLRQLLVNLVGNAIKFTEHGGVRVVASIESTEPSEPRLRIDVNDTGIGIAKDKLDEIFNPFVQADASVTRRFGGTGLGLAICRRLAEAMGGVLTVTSKPGEGSCFTLRLPTGSLEGVETKRPSVCDGLHARTPDEQPVAPAAPTGSLEGMRVLVAEDGDTNRRLIGLVLRRAGIEVEMAVNGQEGVDAALSCGFDAILMDMQMPVMDGYTAAAKLREAGYDGPIIALTAHAMKGDERRCLDAGCSDYLTKPIEAPQLLEKLSALRGEAPPIAPPNEAPAEPSGPIASTLPTDDEEFREVVETFLAKSDAEIARMPALVDAAEWAELREKAHWLKGSGGTAGYAALSDRASDLEDALAGEPDATAAQDAIHRLRTLHGRLVVDLDSAPVG